MTSFITKHGKNLLKTGAAMVLTNLAQSELREATSATLNEISKDFRKARNDFRERRSEKMQAS